jgi:hypothetical protein
VGYLLPFGDASDIIIAFQVVMGKVDVDPRSVLGLM